MLSRAELRARRDGLTRTWAAWFSDGRFTGSAGAPAGPSQAVSAAPERGLLDSWRRSLAWVSPEVMAAPVDDPDETVASWRGSRVAAGLQAVQADLRRAADDGDLIAAVTDRSGRIVWTHSGRVMERRSEQVGFVPGGRWDEASVGTNALALALRTGRPSTVYSAEHFSRAVHGWVCYAVPLTDPRTGDVHGVLDLSTTWDRAHPLIMTTAGVLGRLVTSAGLEQAPATDEPALDLRVLGEWQVRQGGAPLMLPRRQVEVLVLLALHPGGLSLEQLHARLYGDEPVGTATLKAEVSHLRAALHGGIGSRPYRLTVPVDSDLQRVLRALDRGDVRARSPAPAGRCSPARSPPTSGSGGSTSRWRWPTRYSARERWTSYSRMPTATPMTRQPSNICWTCWPRATPERRRPGPGCTARRRRELHPLAVTYLMPTCCSYRPAARFALVRATTYGGHV